VKIDRNFWLGLALGIAVPVVGYAIVLILFEQLTSMGIMTERITGVSQVKQMRTMAVLAIATNLIPFNVFKIKRKQSGMRGVLLATMLYAFAWVIYFWSSLNQ